jgi:dipeptidyl aminopeptidase/acylaminoacyl peptidase
MEEQVRGENMSDGQPETMSYGSWRSPLSAARVAEGSVTQLDLARLTDATYWVESRPSDGGRYVLVRRDEDGGLTDLTPPGYSTRSRVYEYGGAAWTFDGETIYFVNYDDQRIYRLEPGAEPAPITPEPPRPASLRYADPRITPDGRFLICIREIHGEGEPVNDLVILPLDGSAEPRTLVSGRDFYSSPRVSPDGGQFAWVEWPHPNMPWDGTELWLGDLQPDGSLTNTRRVAGGADESVIQPNWSPEGVLHFVSDRTGWWNLYRWAEGGEEQLTSEEADLGRPEWRFNTRHYGFLSGGRIACAFIDQGVTKLSIRQPDGTLQPVESPYTDIAYLSCNWDSGAAMVAAGPATPSGVVLLDAGSGVLTPATLTEAERLPERYVSMPRSVGFPTTGGQTAYGFYYPPTNPDFQGPGDERPPLVVFVHGGPTSHVGPVLSGTTQFFTTRGIAVFDLNYGGSSGYGRAYRERLRENWGIVDVDDAVNAARYLVEQGLVDGGRLAVRGGSAGGYTTLACAAFTDAFGAGIDYYGLADLVAFVATTHKFESRYLDGLIGSWPAEEARFRERSPISRADDIRCPLLVIQGELDKIVPPDQSEVMVAGLQRNGVPHAYLSFPDEQHGFRVAANIQRALEAELAFLSRVFGFGSAEPIAALSSEGQ